MNQKIEHIENTHNLANSIYFKCENCGKILATAGSTIKTYNNLCDCENPKAEDIIYINPKNKT